VRCYRLRNDDARSEGPYTHTIQVAHRRPLNHPTRVPAWPAGELGVVVGASRRRILLGRADRAPRIFSGIIRPQYAHRRRAPDGRDLARPTPTAEEIAAQRAEREAERREWREESISSWLDNADDRYVAALAKFSEAVAGGWAPQNYWDSTPTWPRRRPSTRSPRRSSTGSRAQPRPGRGAHMSGDSLEAATRASG
jgi:hypothetical protein